MGEDDLWNQMVWSYQEPHSCNQITIDYEHVVNHEKFPYEIIAPDCIVVVHFISNINIVIHFPILFKI